jgi:hypothetical protein
MADKKEDKDDYAIELLHDFGFRGAHLGKGYILDGNLDRGWAEHMVAMGDAKKVDKPSGGYEDPPPWAKPVEANKHPTAPRASADAKPEAKADVRHR